ncbi:MAG: 2-oxoacid:acceptor oxidoreductase subunit alpha, partial [Phycisphaeraceae bacterium]|nr:2-oxoacid:acceptor oxidoreductase subunit alpha [Phycisphaeraceae bacterium]
PAALKANLSAVRKGGMIIVNESEFTKVNLRKAGYQDTDTNPLEDDQINSDYRLYKIPLTRLTKESLADSGLSAKEIERNKNMYALGLVYYLYDRPLDSTIKFLEAFGKRKGQELADASINALKAGFNFGETAEMFPMRFHIGKAAIEPGTYRRITGNEATAMGLVAASKLSGKQLIYCTYPITPASDVLHHLAAMRHFGVKTFQAEDEIAAVCAAIGVSFAGQLGVTGTAGPGVALKSEAIGLAGITELPLVILNVQRGGPSTGLPTKTEQSDLLQCMYGRNGDSPVVLLAPSSPSDCFDTAIEAVRIATESMVPVMFLSDGYIANGAEPWSIPDVETLEPIQIKHPTDPEGFQAYGRDEKLARPWAIPGTEGLQHRIGGLEKQHLSGNVSYDPENHQLMTDLRREKVQRVADRIDPLAVAGPEKGSLLVLGWGGTYGAITTAVQRAQSEGKSVASAHLRFLNPFPKNLGEVLKAYEKVLIPELNSGQLRTMIRSQFLVDARGLNKVQGQPFLVDEISQAIDLMLSGKWGEATSLSPHHNQVDPAAQDLNQRLAAHTL